MDRGPRRHALWRSSVRWKAQLEPTSGPDHGRVGSCGRPLRLTTGPGPLETWFFRGRRDSLGSAVGESQPRRPTLVG
eukprot:16445658-Heterocapsa_arctica.AAC.1